MRNALTLAILFLLAVPASAEEPDRIKVPHARHVVAQIACVYCHEGLAAGAEPLIITYPEMRVCGKCHDIKSPENCDQCHTNVSLAGQHRPSFPRGAQFAHEPHLAAGQQCTVCHVSSATGHLSVPGKPDCRKCHQTADDYADCHLCHGPGFNLRPTSHDPGWINRHGMDARSDQDRCTQCHTQTTCQECHAGDNVRPRSHELNYAFNHALDARSGALECTTCHQDPGYCSSCHRAQRIMPTNHSQAGWLNLTGGGRHASEGVFELESCIACHDAGTDDPTCAQCHGR